MKKINCLGIVAVDALSGPFAAYPVRRRQTQVISPGVRFMAGGGAANTASALGQLGIRAAVFSKVGDDSNGVFLIVELKKHGVNTAGIVVSKRDTTPFTFVGIHPDGDRTFVHTPGANKTFSPADLDLKKLLDADMFFYQDFWVLPKLDGRPAAQLLKKARQRGVVTLLDECWGMGPDRAKLEPVLPYADYFLPSYDDLKAVYKGLAPNALIALLHKKGAGKIVLKMGRSGCIMSDGKKRWEIPARPGRVVDTTGAGDCFDAGFIAGLAHGFSDRESAVAGSRAAAACIAHVGGAKGIPDFQKL